MLFSLGHCVTLNGQQKPLSPTHHHQQERNDHRKQEDTEVKVASINYTEEDDDEYNALEDYDSLHIAPNHKNHLSVSSADSIQQNSFG